ncbi:MAG: addiction module protein, partial [Chthoniobacterales bacterium]
PRRTSVHKLGCVRRTQRALAMWHRHLADDVPGTLAGMPMPLRPVAVHRHHAGGAAQNSSLATRRFGLENHGKRENVSDMTVAEAKAMPIGEKFQLMEALWEDMRERFESMPVSDEIKTLLDERRVRAARGESKILDWDKVKSALGRG